jgi:hypothetical protein
MAQYIFTNNTNTTVHLGLIGIAAPIVLLSGNSTSAIQVSHPTSASLHFEAKNRANERVTTTIYVDWQLRNGEHHFSLSSALSPDWREENGEFTWLAGDAHLHFVVKDMTGGVLIVGTIDIDDQKRKK